MNKDFLCITAIAVVVCLSHKPASGGLAYIHLSDGVAGGNTNSTVEWWLGFQTD